MALAGWILCLTPLNVSAAEGEKVQLETVNDNINVRVTVDNANAEQITGVSITLKVDVTQGSEKVDFYFSDKLKGTVKESRYRDGNLYLYVTSDEGIFDTNDELYLGNLAVRAADENQGLTARVSYAEGSLQTVNGAYGEKMVTPGEVSAPVTVDKTGKTPDNGGNSGNGGESGSSNSGSGSGNGNGDSATGGTTSGTKPGSSAAGSAVTNQPNGSDGRTTGRNKASKGSAADGKESGNGIIHQGGIADLLDDGSVLIEETPKPEGQENMKSTGESAAYETLEVETAKPASHKIILSAVCIVGIVIIYIGEEIYRKSKKKEKQDDN